MYFRRPCFHLRVDLAGLQIFDVRGERDSQDPVRIGGKREGSIGYRI